MKQVVVSVTSFETGSKAHNVIPETVHLKGTVRTLDGEVQDLTEARMREIVDLTARAYGGRAEIDYRRGYPVMVNSEEQTAFAAEVASAVSGDCADAPLVMGGEDFSQFGRTDENIPGLLFWVGAVEPSRYEASQDSSLPLPSLHSPFFAPDYDPTIATGVEAMTAAALELFDEG